MRMRTLNRIGMKVPGILKKLNFEVEVGEAVVTELKDLDVWLKNLNFNLAAVGSSGTF